MGMGGVFQAMPPDLKVTGRILSVSESTRRRNPALYGPPQAPAISQNGPTTGDSEPGHGSSAGKVPKPKKAPISPEDRLNKTEKDLLNRLRTGVYGKFDWIGIQCITLSVAWDCRYTPDFMTRASDGEIRLWECKNRQVWEDSIIKLKTAARAYPFWTFVKARRIDGVWTETIIDR